MEASNSAFLFADDSLESRSSASSAFDSVVSLELSFQDCSHLQKVEDCGALHLEADRICKDLLPEKEEGNVEFKYKLVRVNEDRLEHLVTQMNYRLTEGNGKAFYFVGVEDNGVAKGLPDNLLAETIRTLLKMTKKLNCELFIDFIKHGKEGKVAKLMVRRSSKDQGVLDVRICILGDAESGKSTLLGVFTTGKLDNGSGSARMNVFRHRHELVRGRTSSMSRQLIGMSDDGSISNQNSFVSHWKDIIRSSSKLIMFIDLAGHKRYQKTTLFGITSQFPDYALLAVSGTTGVSDITREHLQVALALKIAVFVVITKADLCTNQYPSLTMDQLSKTISALDPSRRLVEINSRQHILQYTERMLYESDIPAFVLSCVTGIGLDDFQFFLQNLQKPYDWTTHSCEETEFLIDEIHEVNRVGVVVTGLIVRGAIGMGAVLMLGPFSDGKFFKVTVSSIHVHRSPVKRAFSGQTASLAIKKIRREEIRKGMVLVDPVLHPKGCFEFEVEITLLFDASRLDVQHEFVLNVDTVTQSARIVHIDNCLVEGSNGKISFKFRHQPEYLRIGAKVIFREANEIIGAGIVSRILD